MINHHATLRAGKLWRDLGNTTLDFYITKISTIVAKGKFGDVNFLDPVGHFAY